MTTSTTSSSTGSMPAVGSAPGSAGGGLPMTPILFVLGSCTSLQIGAALATQLFGELGAFGTTTLRLAIAAVILLVIVRPKVRSFTREQWIAMILFGVVVGAMNGNFYAAIERIPLGTAVAFEFLGPLTVAAVLSTRRSDLLWVALALAGVSLFGIESLTGAASLDLIGVMFALIAAIFWGLYVLTSARVGKLVPGQDGLAVAMAVGALTVLPFGTEGALVGLMDWRLLALAAATAIMASVLPYTLELAALRRLPRHAFGILLSLEPVLALIAGVLLIGQDATPLRMLAAVLVVGASVGVTLTARSSTPDEPQPVDEEPGWDMPIPTHATVTGEMPVVFSDEELWDTEDSRSTRD
ncbi:MAG: DMT family transporter [Brachybacterium sp.]|uniref:EamA family transporter n=1 Tax=Brachybacterium sp. TaxID=1891286 RepID=UPI0026498ACB|nr:DMT family transporter [Brachybacterium sp.]MDN5685406.1 DMT family transporter [Brachybacterium sp.]